MTKILDVGCGMKKIDGAIGLDINPRSAADVIHDLGKVPYPFPDNEFELMYATHVIEHVPDVVLFMTELYRIAKPGAKILIKAPHTTNPDWANDPTHRNHLNSFTLDMFIPERRLYEHYTDVRLSKVSSYVSLAKLWKVLGMEFLVNLDQRFISFRFIRKFWEQYLSSIIRGKELSFEFVVEKIQP